MSVATRSVQTVLIVITTLFMSLSAPALADDKDHKIDLRLFGKSVTDPWDGCRFALWQNNRNPDSDDFAYVLYAPIPDGEALPAWVKIGDDILDVVPVDTGAADQGNLAPVLLYRNDEKKLTVIIDILEQTSIDSGIEIADARLTFVMADKFPFAIRARGLNGCPASMLDEGATPAAGEAAQVTIGPMTPFEGLGSVPRMVMSEIRERAPDCEPENTAGLGASYSVNDALTLWEVPCNLYATAGSSVFILSDNAYATLLSFSMPPGADMNDEMEMLNATLDPQSATVSSYSLDSGGDCGTFTRHQLRPAEGEQLLFIITEYREKIDCDGKADDPANFPLVYQE